MKPDAAQVEMPRYKCHKEVHALKIAEINHATCELHFDAPFAPIRVSSEWLVKHRPRPGGYYVIYADGYTSYSPAGAFEEGYTRL